MSHGFLSSARAVVQFALDLIQDAKDIRRISSLYRILASLEIQSGDLPSARSAQKSLFRLFCDAGRFQDAADVYTSSVEEKEDLLEGVDLSTLEGVEGCLGVGRGEGEGGEKDGGKVDKEEEKEREKEEERCDGQKGAASSLLLRVRMLLYMVNEAERVGDKDRVAKYSKRVLSLDPFSPVARESLERLEESGEEKDKTRLLNEIARIVEGSDSESARIFFLRSLKIDPHQEIPIDGIMRILKAKSEGSDTSKYLEEGVTFAEMLRSLGNLRGSESVFRELFQRDERSVPVVTGLTRILTEQNKSAHALPPLLSHTLSLLSTPPADA